MALPGHLALAFMDPTHQIRIGMILRIIGHATRNMSSRRKGDRTRNRKMSPLQMKTESSTFQPYTLRCKTEFQIYTPSSCYTMIGRVSGRGQEGEHQVAVQREEAERGA